MRRREFITLLGGTAAAWPLAAIAQQEAMPVIGFLDRGSSANMERNLAAFHQGLAEAGFIEGKNVAIEYRWAENHNDQLRALAADLVNRHVAVIAATRSSAPALAAKSATSTIPIVFQTGSDPVKDGLVASLNQPGGNVTGAARLTTELSQKRVGLMLELLPKVTAIGLLTNPKSIQTAEQIKEMQTATQTRGIQLYVANASSDSELDAAFAALARSGVGALIEGSDALFIDKRKHIVALTLSNKIPTMFFERESVVNGGLITYAASFTDSFRQVGLYVGRILRGAKPAELPVQQPTKFELVVNLKTAKAIGLTVPASLLSTADEVIE